MTKRAIIVTSYLAVCHSGETRFIKFKTAMWDAFYKSVDFLWCQVKTMNADCMLFAPDYELYETCFYPTMECYFIVNKGLLHPTSTTKGVGIFSVPIWLYIQGWSGKETHPNHEGRVTSKTFKE